MVSKIVKIVNSQGFHMRPASGFAAAMAKFSSDVKLQVNNTDVNGKSVMNIIAAGIKFGTEVNVICDGADEQAALDEAVSMIEAGFGEQ
ncbi:MAG: HPr family phosphocarrier protein [Emergencia sp.]